MKTGNSCGVPHELPVSAQADFAQRSQASASERPEPKRRVGAAQADFAQRSQASASERPEPKRRVGAGCRMTTRTIMIMAGGTGGHVMPGLAVAAEMRARDWRVVWLGNPSGMEAALVPKHGIPMHWVRVGGVRGKGLATSLMLPFRLLRAFGDSVRALRAIRPAVVLGMGGYVAFPGGMMASLLRRP